MELLFWICAALFFTPYVLYPMLLLLLAALKHRKAVPGRTGEPYHPPVSVLIAARNEEEVIGQRIENLLGQSYPGKMEVIVGSDSSEDGTDEIVRSYSDRGVRLFRSESRLGKPGILQKLKELATGEILVFTDADTVFAEKTVAELVSPFANPTVGCVDGSRRNSLDTESCESTYWKYEKAVKQLCSRLGAVLGATGAVFAVRKDLFLPLSPSRADDFELAVMPRISGYKCLFNGDAVAVEPTPDDAQQYKRMVRIVSWMTVSALLLVGKALARGKLFLVLQLVLHKALRWMAGFFLIAITVLAGLMWAQPPYRAVFLLLMAFHLLALLGYLLKDHLPSKLLLPYYFWLMNLSSIMGLLRLLAGNPIETWERRKSAAEETPGGGRA
ncbi:glycosyltransferase [Candidatus Fermentibacteria bacterium]|nr:glycosyltransferase [Candidatus Fermentibacteria bacterium]